MSKYTILKEQINEWIAREEENLDECSDHNCYMAGVIIGAIEAYRQVLLDIKELERVVVITD